MKKSVKVLGTVVFFVLLALLLAVSLFVMWMIDARPLAYVVMLLSVAGIVLLRYGCFRKFWEEGKLVPLRKFLFGLGTLVFLCFVTVMSRPDLRVSFRGTLARELIREVRDLPAFRGDGMLKLGSTAVGGSEWKAPAGYSNEKIDCGVPVELLRKDGSESDKLLLQLHGGAYVIPLNDLYRSMAVRYSRLWNDAAVMNVDYRIAPAVTFPAALDDALVVWDYVLGCGWKEENIVVAGDSAGGNLALALCLKLRDAGRKLPGGIICMSPWGDLAGEGLSHRTNLMKDPMFGLTRSMRKIMKAQAKQSADGGERDSKKEKPMTALYMGDENPKNPYLSPSYGSYQGFPRMLIQVGTWEVLESDSDSIYQDARSHGVEVTLTKYRGMWHVFQQAGDYVPESVRAWREVRDFLSGF